MLREISIDTAKLQRELAADFDAVTASTTTQLLSRSAFFVRTLRGQVKRQGLGARLGNTIRRKVTRRRGTLRDLEIRIFSSAKVRVGSTGERTDLITIFDEGATIRAFRGTFLAIPIKGAPVPRTSRGRRMSPREVGLEHFVAKVKGSSGVLAFKSNPEVPVYALVPSATIKKLLDVQGAFDRSFSDIEQRIGRDIERRRIRAAARIPVAA